MCCAGDSATNPPAEAMTVTMTLPAISGLDATWMAATTAAPACSATSTHCNLLLEVKPHLHICDCAAVPSHGVLMYFAVAPKTHLPAASNQAGLEALDSLQQPNAGWHRGTKG